MTGTLKHTDLFDTVQTTEPGKMRILLIITTLLTLAMPACLQAQEIARVDAGWPQPLPDHLILGQVSGIAVAPDDTIWVLHRPKTLASDDMANVLQPPQAQCCNPAPAVLQFSQNGELLQAWGGPQWSRAGQRWQQPKQDWPLNEHGIFVDARGFIWIGGNQPADGRHIVVKYTQTGNHVLTLGVPNETGGSNDTRRLGRPADIAVDTGANEVYIADGYLNRRIAVFDSETGAYKRHWGAYGNRPDDAALAPYAPGVELPDQFLGPVHGVVLGPEGLVYVADRTANRLQVFNSDGTFVTEKQIAPQTLANGAVWDMAISPVNDYRWLYVADGANRRIWRLDRRSLEINGYFGQGGRQAGQFDWVHNIAVDSAGNLYTSEVNNGRRIQKFIPVNSPD